MLNAKTFFSHLVQSLQLLGADFATQMDAFPKFVVVPDEIALIFHESFLLLDQILDADLLTNENSKYLTEINDRLDEMSEQENLWTLESLQNSAEWNNVRIKARDILMLLGIPQSPPQLDWITYVGDDSSCES